MFTPVDCFVAIMLLLALIIIRSSRRIGGYRPAAGTRPTPPTTPPGVKPAVNWNNYVCPVCGARGTFFVNCNWGGCADGRS